MQPARAPADSPVKSSATHPQFNVVVPIPVPNELQKAFWSGPLKRPVARATFAAAAMRAGIWDPVRLEEYVLKRNRSLQAPTRHLRRLVNGTPARKPIVMELERGLGGGFVAFWANHPVFQLLDLDWSSKSLDQTLFYALNSISGKMRYYIWPRRQTTSAPGSADYATAVIPDVSMLRRALRDRRNAEHLPELDWLVLSLVTYILAARGRHTELAWEAAFVTNAAFDRAVVLHPPLLVTWRELADAFAAKVWDPVDLRGIFRTGVEGVPRWAESLNEQGILAVPPEAMAMADLGTPYVIPEHIKMMEFPTSRWSRKAK